MAVIGSVSVRVVPSFSGINKSVAKQFSSAGESAGQTFSRSMSRAFKMEAIGGQIRQVSQRTSEIGASLTRNVTAPAGIAAGAIAGIPAALGFQRLVGIDSARAKLEGLGYSAKDVESISQDVTEAIEGTMVTMGEGTDVAAGALAAGVEQGEDLQKYIKLVGDAAAASGRPVNEMAMIFNRVAGSGTLMTQELNMLEDAVPGATATLAESYGVSYEAFREMVTNGEVDAAHFRDVMTEFMGGMGDSVANSWQGMVKNVVAYLGILGESIMGGAFQRAKDELAGFIEFLQTEEAQQWAQDLGQTIGDTFARIVDAVKGAISWWNRLDESTQTWLQRLAIVAVAAGPALFVLGKIGGAIGAVVTAVGKFMKLPIVQHVTKLVNRFGGMRVALGFVARAIGVLTGPIGWIVTALTLAWTSSEDFRQAVKDLGLALWDAGQRIWESLKPAFDSLTGDVFPAVGSALAWIGGLLGDVLGWTINNIVIPAVNWLADAIVWVIDWMKGLGDTSTVQGGFIAAAWDWIKRAANVVVDWFMNTALPWMQRVWDGISTGAQWMWENVLRPTFNFLAAAWDATMRGISWAWENILRPAWNALVAVARWLWNNVLRPVFNFIGKAWSALVTGIRWYWRNVLSPVINLVGDIFKWLWHNVAKPVFTWIADKWNTMVDFLVFAWKIYLQPMIARFGRRVRALWRDYISPALGWIKDRWDWLSDKMTAVWENHVQPMLQKFGDFIQDDVVPKVERGVDMVKDAWNTVKKAFSTPVKWVIDTVWNNGLASAFNNVAKAVDSDARMGKIDTSDWPAFAKGGAVRGPGTGTSDDILAKLSNGEHVLTAKEVKALGGHEKVVELRKRIAAGEDVSPDESKQLAGARPSDAMLPMGGLWETVKAAGSKALSWGRGLLADTAEKLMSPILDGVSSFAADFGLMGNLGSDFIDWGWGEVLDWIRGEDKKSAGAPGTGAGLFDGPTGAWRRPSSGPATSWFGPRWGGFHSGVDIAGGGPTYAAYNGAVQRVGWNILPGRTGIGILLSHGGGLQTYYGHNPVGGPQVSPGQKVKAGQHIGYQGATGNVTGTHLHWELLKNGKAQNVNSMFRDKGGLLPPGSSLVRNETGGAEFIFNQQQFDNLNRMAEKGGNGGVNVTQINNQATTAYRSSQDLVFAMRREARKPRKAGV